VTRGERTKCQIQKRVPFNVKPYKRVQGIHQIEHFFRVAAGLEIDKEDIKHYSDFIDQKLKDLLLIAAQTAKANDHITVV